LIQIDARGMRCPWPAIRLARALREHRGEPVEILADDPAAERELGQLAEGAGARFEIVGADSFRVLP
jgi:tRNA 2-thiouridine synthesizing protein A